MNRSAIATLGAVIGLAAVSPAWATIAFVKNIGTAAKGSSAGTTLALTVTGGVPVGNVVLVGFAMDPRTSSAPTCADDKGNTYVADVDVANGSGTNGVRSLVFRTKVTTALVAGDTITVTHPNTKDRAMSANEFSGFTGGILLDQTATGPAPAGPPRPETRPPRGPTSSCSGRSASRRAARRSRPERATPPCRASSRAPETERAASACSPSTGS